MKTGVNKLRRLAPRRVSPSSKLLAACLTGSVFLAVLILTWTLSHEKSAGDEAATGIRQRMLPSEDGAPHEMGDWKHDDVAEKNVGRSPLEQHSVPQSHRDLASVQRMESAGKIRIPVPKISLHSDYRAGQSACPLSERLREGNRAWLQELGRKAIPAIRHSELAQRLEQHSALQHRMCRRQGEFHAMRALVFSCPQKRCMDLTTGLRGILLAYMLAVVTNRAFFIQMGSWMDFHSHLQVSTSWKSVDWRIASCSWAQMTGENRLKHSLLHSRSLNYMKLRDPRCDRIMQFYRMRPVILGVVSDQDISCMKKILMHGGFDLMHAAYESPYTLAFPRLFSFSDAVLNGEYQLQQEHGWDPDNSVCIHVRSGAFSAYDKGGVGHRNTNDFWRCARMLEHAVGLDERDDVSWLVLSDNDKIPREAENFLTQECGPSRQHLVLTSGSVTRSAPQHHQDSNADGMERLLLDVRLLSRCRYSVLSHSALGTLASSINPSHAPLGSKYHVLVTEQEAGHNKPLSELCKRVTPNWGDFQFL